MKTNFSVAVFSLFCLCFITNCTTRHPIEEAKAILKAHEDFTKAGNLDGIMSNMADDVVIFFAGTPIMKGKEACRNFYGSALKAVKVEFVHEYDGVEVVGDVVILHGTARGKNIMPDSSITNFTAHFLLILKYQSDGKLKLWRGTSTPAS